MGGGPMITCALRGIPVRRRTICRWAAACIGGHIALMPFRQRALARRSVIVEGFSAIGLAALIFMPVFDGGTRSGLDRSSARIGCACLAAILISAPAQ